MTEPTRTFRWEGVYVHATVYALKDRKLGAIDGLQYGYGIATDISLP